MVGRSYFLKGFIWPITESMSLVKQIKELCEPFLASFRSNDFAVMGEILDESWKLKSQITKSISNPEIDRLYGEGCQAGAYGGKLLGGCWQRRVLDVLGAP